MAPHCSYNKSKLLTRASEPGYLSSYSSSGSMLQAQRTSFHSSKVAWCPIDICRCRPLCLRYLLPSLSSVPICPLDLCGLIDAFPDIQPGFIAPTMFVRIACFFFFFFDPLDGKLQEGRTYVFLFTTDSQ